MTDSGKTLNDAEVDYLLARGNDEQPTPVGQAEGAPAATMHGDLEQINLSDIFQTLAMTKMEGVLLVRNPLESRQLFFCDGYVRILVPNRLAVRRLGQRLVTAGLLQGEQLRAALVRQRKEQQPLGELLVSEGLVTQEQIDEIAGMQVADDLFALFTWRHGSFEFWKGEVADAGLRERFEACPEFEVNSLLLEVARRSDEWESILAAISSLDEVPERTDHEPLGEELTATERELLAGADRHTSYRAIAEQTTHGLFDMARAARDLVRQGRLQNLSDEDLVTVAAWHGEGSRQKLALVTLQTLRDRPGQRSPEVMQRCAEVLCAIDERKLAGSMLLELAQAANDSDTALALSRRARELAPHDPGTLSFLRTTLQVHLPPDAPELAQVTLDLIDALVADNRAETALELLADARATGSLQPPLLQRQARTLHKLGRTKAAADCWLELAQQYLASGDRQRAIEALVAVQRLDRSRKDASKLLARLRRTKTTQMIRLAAALLCCALLAGMGVTWWQQQRMEHVLSAAGSEIDALLRLGDRAGARAALHRWTEALGTSEAAEDLKHKVDFADAAEASRLERLQRKQTHESLGEAAAKLQAGEVAEAFQIYHRLAQQPGQQQEIADVQATRCEALVEELERTARALANRLPPPPDATALRANLVTAQAELRTLCRPALLLAHARLRELAVAGALPDDLPSALRDRLALLLGEAGQVLDRARERQQQFAEVLAQQERQQHLDPLFKQARQLEEQHDFAGALRLYQRLAAETGADEHLQQHFRSSIERNTALTDRLTRLAEATANGDYNSALRHYRGLAQAFPDLPLDQLAKLPCRIETLPAGATVRRDGEALGTTPCVLALPPGTAITLRLELTGYLPQDSSLLPRETGQLSRTLIRQPDHERKLTSTVEAPPARAEDHRRWLVDRAGVVQAFDLRQQEALWSYRSGDLSGLLTAPVLHGQLLLFGSLDGDLRALDRDSGKLLWSLPNLPTELAIVRCRQHLAVATTDRRLAVVDLQQAVMSASLDTGDTALRRLFARDQQLLCLDQRGALVAYQMPELTELWQQRLPLQGELHSALRDDDLLVVGERGQLVAVDARTGQLRWQRQEEAENLGAPVLHGDDAWLASPGRLRRHALRDGAQRPGISAPLEPWIGAPLRHGNRLLQACRDGTIAVFDLGSQELLYHLEGHRRAVQMHSDGQTLLVSLPDHRLHFYGKLP